MCIVEQYMKVESTIEEGLQADSKFPTFVTQGKYNV